MCEMKASTEMKSKNMHGIFATDFFMLNCFNAMPSFSSNCWGGEASNSTINLAFVLFHVAGKLCIFDSISVCE